MLLEHLYETDIALLKCDVTVRPQGGLELKIAYDFCTSINM